MGRRDDVSGIQVQGMAGDNEYTFVSAVRGFHVYRRVWVVWTVDGSLRSMVSGRQTTQWTPGSCQAPSLSQLATSRCQTVLINLNDPRGELIHFLILPNDRKNFFGLFE